MHGTAVNPDTGGIAEYKELSTCSDGNLWQASNADEIGRMFQGLGPDSYMPTGASDDSLSEGLTIWQFPALASADTDSINESLRSWEGLPTGNTAMSLADVKEVLRVGKVGAPKSWLQACALLDYWTVLMATLLGTGHEAVAWLLSLARLSRTKALVFDRQVTADLKLPLAVLARIHLTFHAFFESVQGGGPVLLPDIPP
jgi:hypothetical protein